MVISSLKKSDIIGKVIHIHIIFPTKLTAEDTADIPASEQIFDANVERMAIPVILRRLLIYPLSPMDE